ncbi:S-adenosyl-L-methionine-dependent methyltransferase [Neoconidiobolus thromboides FSU 785]|nr:S-adenosyl-L-methionine-dependent methyltransferase [Neoconidiobolus thromboides FSU 785]
MNFYRDASDILTKLELKKGTIKGLCLHDSVRNKKKMYAIICETLKYKSVLIDLLTKVNYYKLEKRSKVNKNLVLVLVHDLLFKRGGIEAPSGVIKEGIEKYKDSLKAELTKLRIKKGVKSNRELIEVPDVYDKIPRYVRVNTIKTTVLKVVKEFIKMGYLFKEYKEKYFCLDQHIDNLLCLPNGIDLHDHSLLKNGCIILQDKASCLPAYILNPEKDSGVIDACAAPGNKTSHLTMIMENQGKIIAYDLDNHRLQLLQKLTQRVGCKIIEPKNQSFLDLDPESKEFEKINSILLDPSCSGSGIVSRLDFLVDTEENEEKEKEKAERLIALSEFQTQMVEHALKFPNVNHVIYSTCSIHKEENEIVVNNILKNHSEEWELVHILPTWKNRGIKENDLSQEITNNVIRCNPKLDFTNGFFVALFHRKGTKLREEPKIRNNYKVINELLQDSKDSNKKQKKIDNNDTETIEIENKSTKNNKRNNDDKMENDNNENNQVKPTKIKKNKVVNKKNKIYFPVTQK